MFISHDKRYFVDVIKDLKNGKINLDYLSRF